ncbi:MAG: hypothetical protein HQL96_13340 [Magnetococcales bacterium]|nr:hypothetical protein [Magnetococcales bacterium]
MAVGPDTSIQREEPTTEEIERQQRRRLIKRLAATGAGVPVMLTLSSGAALAAASGHCIDTTLIYDKDDVRCILNTDVENVPERRAARSTFFATPPATIANGMTGGGDNATDLCLIYHDPTTGNPTSYTTDSSNTWGKNGTNVRITESCWNSFMQP